MEIKLDDLLKENIQLHEEISKDAYVGNYKGNPVKVLLNDFPDEIMYSIFYEDERLDLDELPENWKINYID